MASTNSGSVIWVVGETTGVNETGATVNVADVAPDAPTAAAETAADAVADDLAALHARLVASGVLPN